MSVYGLRGCVESKPWTDSASVAHARADSGSPSLTSNCDEADLYKR